MAESKTACTPKSSLTIEEAHRLWREAEDRVFQAQKDANEAYNTYRLLFLTDEIARKYKSTAGERVSNGG